MGRSSAALGLVMVLGCSCSEPVEVVLDVRDTRYPDVLMLGAERFEPTGEGASWREFELTGLVDGCEFELRIGGMKGGERLEPAYYDGHCDCQCNSDDDLVREEALVVIQQDGSGSSPRGMCYYEICTGGWIVD